LLGPWVGLAAALACTWSAPALAQPAAIDPQLRPYSQPDLLVDVGKGRHIHLFCKGSGGPTVILTAGLGNWSEVWRKVQPSIALKTKVCAWDRAGYGYSSPSSEPQDVLHTTADLERALKAARIPGPYVLVGHSLGGYESLVFADHHPKEVVGMVLVDPSIPDQMRILTSYVGPETATINKTYTERATNFLTGCEDGLRAGTVKTGADPAGCLRPRRPLHTKRDRKDSYQSASPAPFLIETYPKNTRYPTVRP
jgi:pimeloyl-ACP methyl ester carboxylesterase